MPAGAGLVVLLLAGCATRLLEPPPHAASPREVRRQIVPGEQIRVFTTDAQVLQLRVTGLGKDRLKGEREGSRVGIPYGKIHELQAVRNGAWETVAKGANGNAIDPASLLLGIFW